MPTIDRSSTADMLTTSAMMSFVTPEYDNGLCHDHHWARDIAAERRAYPLVADTAAVSTPSSAMHDDIHYAG